MPPASASARVEAEPDDEPPFRLLRGGPAVLVAAVLLAAVLLLVDSPWERHGGWPPMSVREVSRSILEDRRDWVVESNGPVGAPEVGVIVPAVHWRARGGERPTLLVPPGSAVSFTVDTRDVGDGERTTLRAHVGIDRSAGERLRPGWREVLVRFEVLVNGEPAFDRELTLSRTLEAWENEWQPVVRDGASADSGEGLDLHEGDRVLLRTSVRSVPPSKAVLDVPWRVGFADLVLERNVVLDREPANADTPNVVLIVMDTQRRDRLGCYGNERGLTPQVDALAARGTLYEEAYATSSWTWPSTASLLTGLAPEQHGIVDRSSYYVARGLTLLPEVLQRRGYTTAAFTGSPLIVSDKNWDQGFERFDEGPPRTFRKSPDVVPAAIEWLRERSGERFFLYLHLVDPHDPHEPDPDARARFVRSPKPADFTDDSFTRHVWALRHGKDRKDGAVDPTRVAPLEHQRWISELYDASVWTGDLWVGRVLAALDEFGLTDSTVVAYTSDHGEELFDHGLLEHAHSLHGELVQVPLILAGPDIPAGVRSSVPVSNQDLAPTLARIAGARLDGAEPRDLTRPDALDHDRSPVFFRTNHGWWNGWYRTPLLGLRDGDWTLHFAPEAGPWGASQPTSGGERRLFDVGRDPGETRDLAELEPERAAGMLERLKTRTAELEAGRTAPSIGGGEATRDLLEGIGYVEPGGE
jgi:arylsulfatase A-like enzyme